MRTDGNCTTPQSSSYGSRDDLASLGTIDTELVGTPQTHGALETLERKLGWGDLTY